MSEILPNGYVIFCDDIRHEVGNKPSYMGVYLTDLNLHQPAFPATLHKLCVSATYMRSNADRKASPVLKIYLPGDAEPIAQAALPSDQMPAKETNTLGEPTTKFFFRIDIAFSPITLNRAGKMRVVVQQDDDELEIGALMVSLAPPTPNVS